MELTARGNKIIDIQRFLAGTKQDMTDRAGAKGRSLETLYQLSGGLASNEYILSRIRMNDVYDIDLFLSEISEQLKEGQYFISCANHLLGYETQVFEKGRVIPKMGLRQLGFLFHRVMPKMKWGARLYKVLMRGREKRLSKTEILGRLAFAGFEIVQVIEEGVMLSYKVKKKSTPLVGHSPTYGPFIKLNRVVKNGELVKIYKFRTMHPYAEFIQDYVYQQNDLDVGGKLKDDFRISEEGSLFRRYFLDELPMIINLLKGDIKLVGVRPLSEHYFSLYTEAMQRRRKNHKPGLLPPYYSEAVKPATLEEVMISEMKYLIQHEKHPFRTDVKYFFKIWNNILRKKLRSK